MKPIAAFVVALLARSRIGWSALSSKTANRSDDIAIDTLVRVAN